MSVLLLFSAYSREARSRSGPKAREPLHPKHKASGRLAREIPSARRLQGAEHARFRQSPLVAFLRFQRAGHVFQQSMTQAKARALHTGRCATFTTSPDLFHSGNTYELYTFRALIRSEMRTRYRVPSFLAVSCCTQSAGAASKVYPLREAGANRQKPFRSLPSWCFPLCGFPSRCRGASFPAPPLVCFTGFSGRSLIPQLHSRVLPCSEPGCSSLFPKAEELYRPLWGSTPSGGSSEEKLAFR